MARAATRADLLASAQENYVKMMDIIGSMPEEEREAGFDFSRMGNRKEAHWSRDKNIRDVVVHLYEWHRLLLDWVVSNQTGEQKPFIPAPYNWKTYGQMNIKFWEKHQQTRLPNAIALFKDSHGKVMELIGGFSNDELFTKGYFTWTGNTTLGSYCVSSTASHYDWAIKKLKAHDKTYKAGKQ